MTGEDALAILQDFFTTQSQLFPMLSILDEATSEQILQQYAYLVRPGTDYQEYSELRADLSLQMKATVGGYVEQGLYAMLGKTVGEPLNPSFQSRGLPMIPPMERCILLRQCSPPTRWKIGINPCWRECGCIIESKMAAVAF